MRFTLATFGTLGDLHPALALAEGLLARNHEVVVATSEAYRGAVLGIGAAFHPVPPDSPQMTPELARQLMHPTKGSEFIIKDVLLAQIRETYAATLEAARGSDALLCADLNFAGPLVRQVLGIPTASVLLSPSTLFSIHDPSVLPAGTWIAPLQRRSPWVARFFFWMMAVMSRGWDAPVRALRGELGLPAGGHFLMEEKFNLDLTLLLFSPLLAPPQADWAPNIRQPGFVFYDGGGGLSPELTAFLEEGPAPVVFTLGSFAILDPGDFFAESLGAIRALGCRAILLTGSAAPDLGPLPEGVMTAPYAPYGALFPRAGAIVHQGGMGTCGQSLLAGVPSLVVPFSHDQFDNADRMARAGVARSLSRGGYRAEAVAEALGALLGEEAFGEATRRAAGAIRGEPGLAGAVDVIEALGRGALGGPGRE